ncbi:MAG: hypothetical protein GXP21_07185 [Gammaproteobacteria bacterium]|nr:hypothetical protein [Gammaproteobacteria bacterium]
MAKASSPQTSGTTKQRIVGTAVLVALFIIIVLILPSREDEEVEVLQRVEIPPKPADLKVKVLPIEKPKPPRRFTIPKDLPAEPVSDKPKPVKEPQAVKAEPVKEPAVAKARPEPATNDGGKWVIQVGSFSSAENANALYDRLKADNYKVFVDQITVAGVPSHRVLVGPNPDRAKLEPFKVKLEKLLDAPAIIKSYVAE